MRGLTKSFGGVGAVRSVSFSVPAGSLTALIGPNGAGKSTVFNLVTNLYRPDSGEVFLAGRPITGVPPDRITSLGLFRTFQTARVFPQLTVLDNVLVGGYRLGGPVTSRSPCACRGADARSRCWRRGPASCWR